MIMLETFEDPDTTATNDWTINSGNPVASCGAAEGNKSLRFFGSSSLERFLQSPNYNIPSGGQWQFSLKYSDGTGPCAAVERALVTMSYSLNNGATWVELTTFIKKKFE